MDAPLEKGLAALAGPHAVVVPRGVIMAHGAEVHVSFSNRRGAQRGVYAFNSLLWSLPRRLDGAAGRSTDSVNVGQLDICLHQIHFSRWKRLISVKWKIALENWI